MDKKYMEHLIKLNTIIRTCPLCGKPIELPADAGDVTQVAGIGLCHIECLAERTEEEMEAMRQEYPNYVEEGLRDEENEEEKRKQFIIRLRQNNTGGNEVPNSGN